MSPRYHFLACRAALCVVVGVCLSVVATEVDAAGPVIVLGPSDGIAFDQPRATVEVFDDAEGTTSFGPGMFNSFVLDTGANSILASGLVVEGMGSTLPGMKDYGFTTDGTFEELGVGGTTTFDVSLPYRFDFAGTDGERLTLNDVRILSEKDSEATLGGFGGVAGMPLMVNRVTSIDHTIWSAGYDLETVAFSSTLPAGFGHRYSVTAEPQWFLPEDADPMPVWAPLPFVEATFGHNGQDVAGSFLFDTGAQMSMLSERVAFDLGLDLNGDGIFDENDGVLDTVEVGGVGGTVEVPVLGVDEIRIHTDEGVELVWTDLQVIVLEIHEDLIGVLGSDLLTSGWAAAAGTGGGGYIDQLHFDFRDFGVDGTSGTIYYDLNAAYDHVTPEPSSLALLLPGMLLLVGWLRRRR